MRKSLKRFFSNVWGVIRLPEMVILPGQLAFFFVLSVVPILTLISYAASVLNVSTDVIRDFLSEIFSGKLASLLMPSVSGTTMTLGFIVSLCIGFYIASNGADSMIVTSNTIYGIQNGDYVKRRIKAIIMTFILVLLFLFILLVPLFGNKIINIVSSMTISDVIIRNVEIVINVLKGPLAWFIMFFIIKVIYTMAPDKRIPSSQVNYGALFTSILWFVVTWIYSYWINHYANYDVLYGGLANIIILMLWVYILANIFVIGMALNFREETLAKTGSIEFKK